MPTKSQKLFYFSQNGHSKRIPCDWFNPLHITVYGMVPLYILYSMPKTDRVEYRYIDPKNDRPQFVYENVILSAISKLPIL